MDELFRQMSPIFFLFIFIGMWLTVMAVLSRISGWRTLAQQLPANRAPMSGQDYPYTSGAMGSNSFPVSYNNCLNFTLYPNGLKIALMFVFRFQSSPIFLPWSDVVSIEETKIFFYKYIKLHLVHSSTVICVRGNIVPEIIRSYNAYKATK